ncbi:hypothetical protein [Phenylobacterium sp.]|uniref:hypothetical protein n=1 Tax=Phenylobacterium sp. TaxID=1871053 RepID=UPI002E2FB337|nr:hypothetical protein [Phenylobacterium sp.]HEX3367896.1 hypothetical protein [Phenylobacterium sp.]
MALSLAVHVAAGVALLVTWTPPPKPAETPVISVALVTPTPPAPAAPESAPEPKPDNPPPPKLGRAAKLPVTIAPIAARPGPAFVPSVEMSDAQLAGAATVGSGAGGGQGCDMARWLQKALREDHGVQAAVVEAGDAGKAIRVWDGAWVRHPGQEGEGLAAVREAIMWRVAFAPVACRAEPVHGLIVLSLNDGPGASRLAMGAGDWKWQDLLFSRDAGRP